MTKPFIAARIPEELDEKLRQATVVQGRSKTEILVDALSAHLGYEQDKCITNDNSLLSDIEDRLKRLEDKVFSDDNSIIKDNDERSTTVISNKELSKLPGCPLKYGGVRDRHERGQFIELSDGNVYVPIRIGEKPRWKLR